MQKRAYIIFSQLLVIRHAAFRMKRIISVWLPSKLSRVMKITANTTGKKLLEKNIIISIKLGFSVLFNFLFAFQYFLFWLRRYKADIVIIYFQALALENPPGDGYDDFTFNVFHKPGCTFFFTNTPRPLSCLSRAPCFLFRLCCEIGVVSDRISKETVMNAKRYGDRFLFVCNLAQCWKTGLKQCLSRGLIFSIFFPFIWIYSVMVF